MVPLMRQGTLPCAPWWQDHYTCQNPYFKRIEGWRASAPSPYAVEGNTIGICSRKYARLRAYAGA